MLSSVVATRRFIFLRGNNCCVAPFWLMGIKSQTLVLRRAPMSQRAVGGGAVRNKTHNNRVNQAGYVTVILKAPVQCDTTVMRGGELHVLPYPL
jgi:hypothetical protein